LFKAETVRVQNAILSEIEEITQLAKNLVVDGEIVVIKQGKVDFCSLQTISYFIKI
jgi:hypothetical protein